MMTSLISEFSLVLIGFDEDLDKMMWGNIRIIRDLSAFYVFLAVNRCVSKTSRISYEI